MQTVSPSAPPLLLVHDEPAVRRIFERVLGPVGIPFVGLGTYEAGRRVLDGAPRVAAVVADLHLPDGSGVDLLELARERFGRSVSLAMVTADTMVEDALLQRVASAGAVSHVGILRLTDIESLIRNLVVTTSTRRVRG
jgi:CheY-like chemotaxis protein